MTETHRGALLGLVIALVALAGIAIIVAGVMWGGWWRVASGGVTALGIALIVVPGYVNTKQDKNIGGSK